MTYHIRMTISTRMSSDWVQADFQEVYDSNRIALVFDAPQVGQLNEGDWLTLFDHEGLCCLAMIDEISNDLAYCLIDLGSWWTNQGVSRDYSTAVFASKLIPVPVGQF